MNVKQTSIEAGTKNLIPLNQRSEEEKRKICSLGGKKRVEQKKELRHAKEILTELLAKDLTKEDVKKILGKEDTLTGSKSAYDVMMEKAFKIATEQDNVKAIEFLRDTVGDKPTDNVKIDANVITDNDRKLLELLANKGKDAD